MAVGDVQNRVNVGNQVAQAGGIANTNRTTEQQENQVTPQAVNQNQPAPGNRNVTRTQNTPAPQVNQPAAAVSGTGQGEQEIIDVNTRNQQTQITQIQNPAGGAGAGTAHPTQTIEEDILLSTNRTEDRNITVEGAAVRENPANNAVQRTAEKQINRIENTNANQANTPPRLTTAVNMLTQENQVGSRVDTLA